MQCPGSHLVYEWSTYAQRRAMFKRLVLVSRPSISIEVCRMNKMLRLSVIRSRVNLTSSISIKRYIVLSASFV